MYKSALQESAMAARIYNREDNLYLSTLYLAILCKELNVSADYLLFGNEWDR